MYRIKKNYGKNLIHKIIRIGYVNNIGAGWVALLENWRAMCPKMFDIVILSENKLETVITDEDKSMVKVL